MPTQTPPDLPIVFRGIYLAGNPARRPGMTASVASNVRIMRNNWLRLRGGRKKRYNTAGGTVQQITPFRDPNFAGSSTHMVQVKVGSTVTWTWFDVLTYILDPFGIGTITNTYDSSWTVSNPAAITNITDRPVFYNGLGVRDGTDSKPPLWSYYAGVKRYFGLDAYVPGGANPTVAFAAGAGYNNVNESVKIYVGLYHEPSAHYSNGKLCGTIGATGATGTITVSNLSRLVPVYNNATEQGELKYVFYASIDNLQVPYLILNAAGTGPYTVSIGSSTASLSIVDNSSEDGNGWDLDVTTEMPVVNFPPRPMKSVWVVNQRMYGIPLSGGSGAGSDFTYQWQTRSLAGVCWSKAFGDDRETKVVGDPLQSWPLENHKATPNVETPKWGCPSLSGQASLIWTNTSVCLLNELATNMHEFEDISRIHGLSHANTVRVTPYGIAWVDQRNQVCLLSGDTKADLRVISGNYQDWMIGKTVTCADYVLDPVNEIDRYQIWFSDGTTLVHDFTLVDQDFPDGQAYTGTGQDFTAAATLVGTDGVRNYVVAKGGLYTHETQPENGLIPTTDDTFSNTTDQTYTTADISGEYRFNWDSFGSWRERKPLAAVYVIGDGATSAQLSASPLAMKWWGDFQEVPGTPNAVAAAIEYETAINWMYRFTPTQAHRWYFKIGFTIAGHTTDDSDFLWQRRPGVEGDLDKNFYGSICEAAYLLGRPN